MPVNLGTPDFFWPEALPPRPTDGHKGTFGRALFVVGSQGYYGAPLYAPLAFLRCGGGYANVFCTARVAQILAANGQGAGFVYYEGEECPQTGVLANSPENRDKAIRAASNVDFVVVGPGLGEGTQNFLDRFLTRLNSRTPNMPVLLDADALDDHLACIPDRFILTPHLGELMRLVKCYPAVDDPVKKAPSLLESLKNRHMADLKNRDGDGEFGEGVLLIKGQHSRVLSISRGTEPVLGSFTKTSITRNPSGNSGLAKAGSGDVLCGCIAGIYCLLRLGPQKDSKELLADATRCAVFIHGVAGDLTAKDLGEDSMTPFDVLKMGLPQAMKKWRAYSTGNTRDLWAKDYPEISDS